MNKKILDTIALILVIIGGLNWGIWGLFAVNLVETIFMNVLLIQIVYTLVGISAIYLAFVFKKIGKR